jgi:mRNA-degrading endonuclease RelE of RelBE toxin-antitoxin system
MKSSVTKEFRKRLAQLPQAIQQQASKTYGIRCSDPFHSGLQFKKVSLRQPIYSVRVGLNYRAIGLLEENHIYWFWIGPHSEYDELLKRL